MANETSGFNALNLPILADSAVAGNMAAPFDTEVAGGSAPQAAALTVNQLSGGAFGIVAAAGASQGTATALPTLAQNVQVTVTASTEGVLLPVPSTGKVRRIFVPGTVGVKVYPPLHCFLDAGASNAATLLAAGKGNIYIGTDATHWKTMVKGA
jgi:hypothetical protein